MSRSEAFRNVMTGIAALATPIAVAYLANYYASLTKDKDVGVKFVELSTTILSKPPDQSDASIRRWAIKILERYSDVPLSEEARQAITDQVPLPQTRYTPLSEGTQTYEGTRVITRIIVRDTQQDDLDKELAGLRGRKVAYHYLIDKDGTIRMLADENDIAYHTSGNNADSIGIGLMHSSGRPYPAAQSDALRKLLASICQRRKIPRDRVLSAGQIDPARASDFESIRGLVTADIP